MNCEGVRRERRLFGKFVLEKEMGECALLCPLNHAWNIPLTFPLTFRLPSYICPPQDWFTSLTPFAAQSFFSLGPVHA